MFTRYCIIGCLMVATATGLLVRGVHHHWGHVPGDHVHAGPVADAGHHHRHASPLNSSESDPIPVEDGDCSLCALMVELDDSWETPCDPTGERLTFESHTIADERRPTLLVETPQESRGPPTQLFV